MYYAYEGQHDLGKEPCGTSGKAIWKDLKTNRGALRRARRRFPHGFRLFRFTNFYDNNTFEEVR